MLFTQFEFIFIFVPITLFGYFLLGKLSFTATPRLVWLAAASLVFYGYWDVRFIPVIGISMIANFYFGLRLSAAAPHSGRRKFVFIVAIAANLIALGVFKYTNFLIFTADWLTHAHLETLPIVLPLGISFFTFTQIAYLADVYSGYPHEGHFPKYALFVTYFPHLVAGPILHHREMMPQFGSEASRWFSPERMAIGLTVFGIGLFKKVIIADGFALIANPVFTAAGSVPVSSFDAWCGALAYSLQIYFDFSGYSDMAIGLSSMFGIVLPFNFDAPYKSRSIVEFWRRWHITLSRFLRDYLYIPMGGSRHGAIRRQINLLLTMLLGGLWHGAGWTFVIWGGLHGIFLIVNHSWTRLHSRVPAVARIVANPAYPLVALILTQFCVVIAWVFFRSEHFEIARHMLVAMAGFTAAPGLPGIAGWDLALIAGAYFICFVAPNVNEMFESWNVGLVTYNNPRPWSLLRIKWWPNFRWAVTTAAVLLIAISVSLITGEVSPFLYFQF